MKLGRRLHHDPLSRGYAYQPTTFIPRSVTHRIDARPLDQGDLNGCTGFAAGQWLNCRAAAPNRERYNKFRATHNNLSYTKNYDGCALYSAATEFDPYPWTYPPDDEGSSGLGAAKALKFADAIDQYQHTFSFESFLVALSRQPVLIGTAWTKSMLDPDRHGVIKPTGPLDGEGGHEYLGIGINWPDKLIRIRNSWGDWGINGNAYIPMDAMARLLAAQGDCIVPVIAGP